jgi:hypothetical protein
MLTYDNNGQLIAWQNKPTSPTTTDSFLYDGEGNRVAPSTSMCEEPLPNTFNVIRAVVLHTAILHKNGRLNLECFNSSSDLRLADAELLHDQI